MNWLKWHVGTFTDPKFAVIAKRTGQPRAIVLAVWVALLETAGNAFQRFGNDGNGGDVSSFNPEDIGAALDLEPEVVTSVFAAFMARGMVTDDRHIAAWDKRQNQDYSTDRVRKFREKQRGENHPAKRNETRFTVSETLGNAEERRGEKNISVPDGTGAAAPDLKTRLFGDCLSWLQLATGRTSQNLRPTVGRWVKDFGEIAVMEAFMEAQAKRPVDAVGWIFGSLKRKGKHGRADDTAARRTALAGAFEDCLDDGTGGRPADQPQGAGGQTGADAGGVAAAREFSADRAVLSRSTG